MATLTERKAVVLFSADFDEQCASETPHRGYLSDTIVQMADGTRYSVFFIDPVRLRQELEILARSGQPFFAEANLIVLPEVTVAAIRTAVESLADQGFFQQLKPLS